VTRASRPAALNRILATGPAALTVMTAVTGDAGSHTEFPPWEAWTTTGPAPVGVS